MVDFNINYSCGRTSRRASQACFGDLKYPNEIREWDDVPSASQWTTVEYTNPDEHGKAIMAGMNALAPYLKPSGYVEVDASIPGDEMLAIFGAYRASDRLHEVGVQATSPLRTLLLRELGPRSPYYNGTQTPSVDGEEALFDMSRLSLPDAVSLLITTEQRGKLYRGYQRPASEGYVRNNSHCGPGESVTGYWQAPCVTGSKLTQRDKLLPFYQVMWHSIDATDMDEFIRKGDEFLTSVLVHTLDVFQSGKHAEAIEAFMANPTYENLPDDQRVANTCLIWQNLQREVV